MDLLKEFLKEKKLKLVEKISKGYSSEVFLVENEKKEKLALKLEKEKSPRIEMVKKEVENLKLANSVGIGPRLLDWNKEKGIVLMEFVKGKTFNEWLFEEPKKKELEFFVNELIEQGKKLDEIGLDHGQLGGKGKNILVRKGKPVIIDFEKASQNRKVHNKNTLQAFLFRNPCSAITKKIKKILEKEN